MNEDYVDFHYSGPQGQIPPHISARSVYGFAPMSPAQMGQLMAQGRAYATAMGAPLAAQAVPAGSDDVAVAGGAAAGVLGGADRGCVGKGRPV